VENKLRMLGTAGSECNVEDVDPNTEYVSASIYKGIINAIKSPGRAYGEYDSVTGSTIEFIDSVVGVYGQYSVDSD